MTDTDAMVTVNGSSTILRGDVIEQLRSFDDNTFDACLCDPPYLLEFMGKEFDKQHLQMEGSNDGQKMYQWHLGWCQELYRVLKPGAFAMVFGGTRTYYRLACALEDVGFEIRDTIEWMYGSGFPKSHDISKAIDKINGEVNRSLEFCSWFRGTGIKRGEADSILRSSGLISEKGTMAGHFFAISVSGQPAVPTREIFECLRPYLSCDIPDRIEEIIDRAEAEREIVGNYKYNRSGSGNWSSEVSGGMFKEQSREVDITVPALEQSALWSGYGTALKPAHEPIILCMKPCNGTFAENALEHGVAGLNIDGGRIPGSWSTWQAVRGETIPEGGKMPFSEQEHKRNPESPLGRWPANLILSHTPYCQERMKSRDDIERSLEFKESVADINRSELVAWDCHPLCPVRLLDEQSGMLTAGHYPKVRNKSIFNSSRVVSGSSDEKTVSGGASRFFYCAKVSTRERNAGNIDCKHPTLKPIDLCRYLATLLLPPPREDDLRHIVVPFSGAGSEVAGALSAGWEMVIGIEADPEYIKWSESRIPSLTSGEPIKPTKRSPKPDSTLDLDLDIFS